MSEDYENVKKQEPTPWSFWPTIGLSCVIAITYVLAGIIVFIGLIVISKLKDTQFNIEQFSSSLESNGFFLIMATSLGGLFVIGLILLFTKIRKGITINEYLCLRRTRLKEFVKWIIILLIFIVCVETLSFLTGRPLVSEDMTRIYSTARFTPLLWLALIIIAPVSEELFFRGFLIKGLENSKIGPIGAIVATSLCWTVLHIQFDMFEIIVTFIGGLLLGFARLKSRSIYTAIMMHSVWNLVATIEAAAYLS